MFAVLVENDISQRYGVISVACFFFPAIGFLFLTAPWDDIVAEVSGGPKTDKGETLEAGYPSGIESPRLISPSVGPE